MTSRMDNFTKEELEKIVKESSYYREVLKKLGYITINGSNNNTLKRRLEKFKISTEHFMSNCNPIQRNEDNVFCKDSTVGQGGLRRWYMKLNKSEYICSICGQLPIWNNKPLVLTLDHINGNNTDNVLENLRWICPNCDRQLPTFAGKNIPKFNDNVKVNEKILCSYCNTNEVSSKEFYCKNCSAFLSRKVNRPSRDDLKNLIRTKSFVQIGKDFNVSDNAVKKWCDYYKLPRHYHEIKNISDENWELI